MNIYGVGRQTASRARTWDNVGVQYGLERSWTARSRRAEFLDLNAKVGSWKEPGEMVHEGFPFVAPPPSPGDGFDPWSARNMNLSPDGGVDSGAAAQRRPRGDARGLPERLRFDGDIDIPMIDWRHYLEEQLDMHHSHQSFATRQRLQPRRRRRQQVIWFTDARPAVAFDQTPEAFEVIDEWMANIRERPGAAWRATSRRSRWTAASRRRASRSPAARTSGTASSTARPARRVHAGVPDLRSSRTRGGRSDRGRHLQVRAPGVDAAIASGAYGLGAERRREGAPRADLPDRRGLR